MVFLVCLYNVWVAAESKSPIDKEEGKNQSRDNLFFYDIMNYILRQYFSNTCNFGPFCYVCISKHGFEEHQHNLVGISNFSISRINIIEINLVPLLSPIFNQFNSSPCKGLLNSKWINQKINNNASVEYLQDSWCQLLSHDG